MRIFFVVLGCQHCSCQSAWSRVVLLILWFLRWGGSGWGKCSSCSLGGPGLPLLVLLPLSLTILFLPPFPAYFSCCHLILSCHTAGENVLKPFPVELLFLFILHDGGGVQVLISENSIRAVCNTPPWFLYLHMVFIWLFFWVWYTRFSFFEDADAGVFSLHLNSCHYPDLLDSLGCLLGDLQQSIRWGSRRIWRYLKAFPCGETGGEESVQRATKVPPLSITLFIHPGNREKQSNHGECGQ